MSRNLTDIIKDLKPIEIIGNTSKVVANIVFDSRKVIKGSLFVAIKGTQVDGHDYISQVVEDGASVIVCEKLPEVLSQDVVYLKVNDASDALGWLAAAFYNYPSQKIKLVGVTGTNGKTTIASLLYRLVREMGYEAGLFSTVANYIGSEKIDATHTTPDPVTLNSLLEEMLEVGCDFCFMEVSSHAVDQRRIAGLYFQGGIFTNLTHDHLDYHLTFDAYLKAKKRFFDELPKTAFALVNTDDKHGNVMVQNTQAFIARYSLREMADFKARIIESLFEGMHLTIDGCELWTPFIGKFNASNLLAVYASAILLGLDNQEVLVALSKLQPVDGRFETIQSNNGITAVVDYAHTPDALKNVIEAINQICQPGQQVICVVGAGGNRDKTKRPIMAKVAVEGCSKVILTSDNPRNEEADDIIEQMMEGVPFKEKMKVVAISNRKEAIRTACMIASKGDIILVAGKGHETYQEIKGVRHHFDDREVLREVFNQQ